MINQPRMHSPTATGAPADGYSGSFGSLVYETGVYRPPLASVSDHGSPLTPLDGASMQTSTSMAVRGVWSLLYFSGGTVRSTEWAVTRAAAPMLCVDPRGTGSFADTEDGEAAWGEPAAAVDDLEEPDGSAVTVTGTLAVTVVVCALVPAQAESSSTLTIVVTSRVFISSSPRFDHRPGPADVFGQYELHSVPVLAEGCVGAHVAARRF